jgi:hypothetical protein
LSCGDLSHVLSAVRITAEFHFPESSSDRGRLSLHAFSSSPALALITTSRLPLISSWVRLPVAADSDLHQNTPARPRRVIYHAINFGIFVVTACDRADAGELRRH